jgi:hypothetical protein
MTTQPTTSGTGDARAKDPSSPSDTAGENEHAVRLVGQRAGKTGKEAGEISPVAHRLGFGAESHRSGSARPTSTRVDPGVTSSEAARIRDRVRETGAPPSPSAARSGNAAHLRRGSEPAPVGSESGDAVLAPILVAFPQANFSGMGSTRSCHRREESRPRRRPGPGRPAHGTVRDPGRRASPRGDDERDAVAATSPPTSFTGSFSRNVRTPAESRTGPPSAPPKGWPTSLTSTPRGARSSAERSPRR